MKPNTMKAAATEPPRPRPVDSDEITGRLWPNALLLGQDNELVDARKLTKEQHRSAAMEAIIEVQSLLQVLDEALHPRQVMDMTPHEQERAIHAVHAIRRRMDEAAHHFFSQ